MAIHENQAFTLKLNWEPLDDVDPSDAESGYVHYEDPNETEGDWPDGVLDTDNLTLSYDVPVDTCAAGGWGFHAMIRFPGNVVVPGEVLVTNIEPLGKKK